MQEVVGIVVGAFFMTIVGYMQYRMVESKDIVKVDEGYKILEFGRNYRIFWTFLFVCMLILCVYVVCGFNYEYAIQGFLVFIVFGPLLYLATTSFLGAFCFFVKWNDEEVVGIDLYFKTSKVAWNDISMSYYSEGFQSIKLVSNSGQEIWVPAVAQGFDTFADALLTQLVERDIKVKFKTVDVQQRKIEVPITHV